jgi:hypothetical protein
MDVAKADVQTQLDYIVKIFTEDSGYIVDILNYPTKYSKSLMSTLLFKPFL